MYKYQCKSRFPILICLDNTIIEIYPGQEIALENKISHRNLVLVK